MKYCNLISTILLLILLPGVLFAQTTPLSTLEQKFSYAMGFRVVEQLQQKLEQTGIQLDEITFTQAIQDALSGAQPQLSGEEIKAVLQIYQTKQFMKQATVTIANKQRGDAFRKANRAKDGVIETASGLQYRVLEEGRGKQPVTTNTVVLHYRGTHVNGEEFDSSYADSEPATAGLDEVIDGWREALQLMQEGARWELVVPPELAYGDQGSGNIGPNETLIFEIELISVK